MITVVLGIFLLGKSGVPSPSRPWLRSILDVTSCGHQQVGWGLHFCASKSFHNGFKWYATKLLLMDVAPGTQVGPRPYTQAQHDSNCLVKRMPRRPAMCYDVHSSA
eukprot:6186459-Pleurochrysis_carterae.AAC.6